MSTKSVSRYKQLLATQVDNLHEVSHFSTKHLISALNYTQDFGTTVEESLKRTTSTKWATLTKSRIVPCQILWFMPLSALSTMSRSPIGANSDWIHQLDSKNNGPVLLFKTIFWHWQCFSSSVAMDCKKLKMDWTLGKQDTGHIANKIPRHTYNKIQDIQQPDTCITDSVQIMKVPKKVTLK